MEKCEKFRRHYIFYGCVQGVGFRYRASYAASLLGLTGWVKNEWDGSVVMEVQGDLESIQKMIEMLGQNRYVRIDNMTCADIPLESELGFHVR